MSMSVAQLIKELEKIDNRFLEVEICINGSTYSTYEILKVKKDNKKVMIHISDLDDD